MANSLVLSNLQTFNAKYKNSLWYGAVCLLIGVALIELLRTAWISDDSAITLRCVLNFLSGYGPNFNIDERVQAYTHPLWFLLLTASTFVIHNIFTATFCLSIAISLSTIALLLTCSKTKSGAITGVLLLMLSKAYVDFSTSGLENPLSHLLILLSVILGLRVNRDQSRKSMLVFLLVSCSLYLSRPDLMLLIAPWCYLNIVKHRQPSLKITLLLGVSPILLWTIFSLLYYGVPLSNTAYAKLSTDLPLAEQLFYGLRYVLDTVLRDPLTACTIATGIIFGSFGSAQQKSLVVGIILYVLYVIAIGGDFMAGRFLTAPFFVAVLILTFFDVARLNRIIGILLVLTGGFTVNQTLLSGATYHADGVGKWGITDERGFYYQNYGLLPLYKKGVLGLSLVWDKNVRIAGIAPVTGGLGFKSLAFGPSIHVVDLIGLADPLLVRLPSIKTTLWRAGHQVHQLPLGYNDSLLENNNQLQDSRLASFYDAIRKITRGDIFTLDRLSAIWTFNTSRSPDFSDYSTLSDKLTSPTFIQYENIPKTIVESGTLMNDNTVLFEQWMILDIVFPAASNIHELDISLNDQQTFLLKYADRDEFKELGLINGESLSVVPSLSQPDSFNLPANKKLIRHNLIFDKPITTDRIRIIPIGKGDGMYGLGHLIIQ